MKLAVSSTGGGAGDTTIGGSVSGGGTKPIKSPQTLVASGELEPSEIQDLGDLVPELLKIKDSAEAPLVFRIQIEFGDELKVPPPAEIEKINALLGKLKQGLKLG